MGLICKKKKRQKAQTAKNGHISVTDRAEKWFGLWNLVEGCGERTAKVKTDELDRSDPSLLFFSVGRGTYWFENPNFYFQSLI